MALLLMMMALVLTSTSVFDVFAAASAEDLI